MHLCAVSEFGFETFFLPKHKQRAYIDPRIPRKVDYLALHILHVQWCSERITSSSEPEDAQ